jgi:hypothetical protein
MTPLRQRMLEDMQIRNYSPHTIDGYLRYAAQFAKHFHTAVSANLLYGFGQFNLRMLKSEAYGLVCARSLS